MKGWSREMRHVPCSPAGFHISEVLLERLSLSVEEPQARQDSSADSPRPSVGTQANSRAWLKRAFPSARQRGPSDDVGGGRLLAVHSHALEEHVPALVGPLSLAVAGNGDGGAGNKSGKQADSLLEFLEPGERFVELAVLRSDP